MHHNKSSITIPRRLRQRPKYQGYPIPYIALVYPDGKPDFKINNIANVLSCIRGKLCGLCGQQIKDVFVFIGGEKSVESGWFVDPPMHEDCAIYAAKVCPFLSNADGKYSEAPLKQLEGFNYNFDETQTVRSRRMCLYYTKSFEVSINDSSIYMLATKPIKLDWDQMPESICPDQKL